jgi:hypothetical protein
MRKQLEAESSMDWTWLKRAKMKARATIDLMIL